MVDSPRHSGHPSKGGLVLTVGRCPTRRRAAGAGRVCGPPAGCRIVGAVDPSLTLAADFPNPSRADWLDAVEKVLKGADFDRTLVTKTADGLEIGPLYTADDVDTSTDPAGMPGQSPFERGPLAAPRPHGSWDVRATVAHPDMVAANATALSELLNGATSIELALDLAGNGSGVGIRSDRDLAAILDGVLVEVAPISLSAGAHAGVVGHWMLDLLGDTSAPGGELGIDPLGTLAATGLLPQGIEVLWDDAAALATRCCDTQPAIRAVTVASAAVHAAGATEAQELAWLLASGTEALRALNARGIEAEAAARQITFDVTSDVDVFTTVAKLRAFRWVWTTVLAQSGVDTSGVGLIRLNARSAWRSLTAVDPWVNLLRGTATTFAAVIGGADAVVVAPFDRPDDRPGSLASRMARNTQLLLQDESGLGRVMDPAGGSWFVESLTDRTADAAWTTFQQIERHGGATAALRDGAVDRVLRASADARAQRVADRRHAITGVSEFPLLDEVRPDPPSPVPIDDREPVPLHGTPTAIDPLAAERLSAPFERLRAAAAAAEQRPTVWLATLGSVASHTARVGFATNFFAAGGVDTESNNSGPDQVAPDPSAAGIAGRFAQSGATVACICGSDADYAQQAGHLALALRESGATRIYLAGRPGEYESAWRDAGIDEFIAIGTDVVATLTDLHHHLGLS